MSAGRWAAAAAAAGLHRPLNNDRHSICFSFITSYYLRRFSSRSRLFGISLSGYVVLISESMVTRTRMVKVKICSAIISH
jgi:hypothetical protein